MNKKDVYLSIIFSLLIVLYVYFLINPTNSNFVNYSILIVIVLLLVFVITEAASKKINIKSKDSIFGLFVNASDTLYIIMSSRDKKIVYLSRNADKILNISTENKTNEQIVFNVLNIDSIKRELNSWDKKTSYVSQMIEYHNKKDMWIRIKLYPYLEKEEEYYVIEIIDATKEHERQHLLVTQASNIKLRESQLNEITQASYDLEIDVDLALNKYELKYFKSDNKYFGEDKSGVYQEKIDEIKNNYINKSDIEILKVLDLKELKKSFSHFDLETKTIRYRIGNEDKNNIWLESTIFYLSNRNNNKVTILTKNVTEDANEIRKQNVMLQNALNDLKIADKNKTELIKTISHDVRTPLTNILGLSDSLLTKKLNNDIKEDIKSINDSSIEMLDIIDDMLDINNLDKTIKKEYNIFKIFNKIVNNANELAEAKNIKLNLNMDTNLPVVLEGDSKKITKIVTELINNSIKYTDEGKINVNVRGEKKDNDVNLIITIKDTGIGISKKKMDKIMDPKNDDEYSAIKKIVDSLGGSFEIESREKEFTKVTLNITQKIIEDNKIREKLDKNKNAITFDLSDKKILIVDDNKLNLKVTSKLLSPYNPQIVLLESGQEAIEKVGKETFDLILLDQMMPSISGTEVLNKLKENKDFKTPVVVLTADAIEGQKEKYLSDGFDDYISKPIDRGELSIVLKKFLKK